MDILLVVSGIIINWSYIPEAITVIAKTDFHPLLPEILIGLILCFAIPFYIGYLSVPTRNESIIKKCWENLKSGKAVATGIGIFLRIRKGSQFLVSARDTKESITGKDLSGLFQLIGAGMTLSDFDHSDDYQQPIISTAERALKERAKLKLKKRDFPLKLVPASAVIKEGDVENQIDLAFVIDLPMEFIEETPEFQELLKKGNLQWVSYAELQEIKFIGPRMKFLATNSVLNS